MPIDLTGAQISCDSLLLNSWSFVRRSEESELFPRLGLHIQIMVTFKRERGWLEGPRDSVKSLSASDNLQRSWSVIVWYVIGLEGIIGIIVNGCNL